MEIELKLLIAPDAVNAFRRHPLLKKLAIAKPYKQQLISTYFDTPDAVLMQHQAGLRVRQVEGKFIQTLKAGGQVDSGLHQRNEWESEVKACAPDIAALRGLLKPKSPWAKLLAQPEMTAQLAPLFTTKFQRSVWLLRLASGDEVELVLDQGTIEYGAGAKAVSTPICEIELELKTGKAAHLFAFAVELQKSIPLRVSDVSKAERGYRLALPTTTEKTIEIVHASTPALSERQTIGQGFQGIVANCVAQIQGNEAGVVLGTDVESVHQMRVGVRRLRSALAMFGDHLPLPDTLMVDCEWLAQHLGAVRDWDVFAGTTLDAVASVCKEMPAFQTLRQQALDVAQENRVTMVEAINSPRYARLLLTLGACVHGADVGLSEDASLGDFASVQLAHYQKKMVQHGKGVAHSNAAERHRLRIAAKKLRYTLAFFASLYSAKKFNAYVAGLSGLQDALGEINDASVADRLLRTCAEGHAELVEVCAYIRGYSVARNEKNLKKLVKLWKTFGQLNADF